MISLTDDIAALLDERIPPTIGHLVNLTRKASELEAYVNQLTAFYAALVGSGEELPTADNIERHLLGVLRPLLRRLNARRDVVSRMVAA